MTEKEQIIINGIDISGCRNFDIESYKLGVYDCDLNELQGYCRCDNECYFKQLVRKTQECEELKERASIAEDNFACEIQARLYHQNEWLKFSEENDRYRKALEEIEGYTQIQLDGFGNDVYSMDKTAINHILDIISKAKEKTNDR